MPSENAPARVAPVSSLQDERGGAGDAAQGHYEVLTAAYPERSCFIFAKASRLRRACVLVSHSKLFENFIFLVILCNCVTLGLSSNRQGFDDTAMGQAISKIDYVFIAIFTIEMMLKIISMGFVLKKGTYLRDGWNVLDFIVVVVSYVGLMGNSNLSGLRTIRALRPLRAVRRIKGMRVLVTTMIGSLPMLFDVFVLCAFTFFMFGIIAVQLFAGVLRNRCGSPDFNGAYDVALSGRGSSSSGGGVALQQQQQQLANVSYVVPDEETEDMCSEPLSTEVMWFTSPEPGGSPTAVGGKAYAGRACEGGMYCTWYGNPYGGLVSYDNMLWSWLTIFQHITLSGWTDVMYMVMDAVNYWVWIFYVGLIIFGAFFMINLALAVLSVNFSADNLHEETAEAEAKEKAAAGRELEEELKRGAQQQRQQDGGEEATGGGGDARGPRTTITNVMGHLRARKRRREQDGEDPSVATGSPPPPGLGAVRRLAWRVAVSRTLELTTAALILINTAVMCVNWYGMPARVEAATNYINYGLTGYFVVELLIRLGAFGFRRFFRSGMNIFDAFVVSVSLLELIIDLVPSLSGVGPLSVLRAFRLLRIFRLARNWRQLNTILSGMFRSVTASIMLVGLMLLFLFIASLIGGELFGYEFMFCDYVAGASAVCPPGQALWGECPNHFYCYLPCSSDQYGSWVDAPGSFYNDLAYCDRFCAEGASAAANASSTTPALTGSNTTASADDGSSSCEYLAMVGKSQVPRAHFDNVLWGIYTVFQLLTGEDWNSVMYNGMTRVSYWASLYFVGVIVIGTYLVFNLFIAILLDNLSSQVEEKKAGQNAKKEEGKEKEEGRGQEQDGKSSAAADGAAADTAGDAAGTGADAAAFIAGSLDDDAARAEKSSSGGEDGRGGSDSKRAGTKASPPSSGGAVPDGAAATAEEASGPRRSVGQPTEPGQATSPGSSAAAATAAQGAAGAAAAAGGDGGGVPRPVAEALEAKNADGVACIDLTAWAGLAPADTAAAVPPAGALLGEAEAKGSGGADGIAASAPGGPSPQAAAAAAALELLAREASVASSSWRRQRKPQREASVGRIPRHASSRSVLTQIKTVGTNAAAAAVAAATAVSGRPASGSGAAPWEECMEGRSLLLLSPPNRLRRAAAATVHHPLFEAAILALIAASCVCLVLDSPGLDPDSRLALALRYLDYAFTGAFTVEAALKILTFGFAFTGRHAYIRSGWNVLDLAIVLLGWALIAVEALGLGGGNNVKVLRVLRALRALRPLRAVHRFPGLRHVVTALFAVLPAMLNVALVCIFFYLIFAILAVNLFKGKLYNCIDAASGERIDPFYVMPYGSELTRSWCEAGGGVQTITQSAYHSAMNVTMPEYTMVTQWVNLQNNFDNVGIALLTLFQAATLSMWVDITFSGVDATGIDKQPLWNHSPIMILLFILFIVVCSFFVLNLFIGVTLDKFAEIHDAEKSTHAVALSPEQQSWVDTQQMLLRTKIAFRAPRPAASTQRSWPVAAWLALRRGLYDVVTDPLFDWAMMVVIISNVVFMALVHVDMTQEWQDIMTYSNLVFTAIFVLEATLKLVAFGPINYFRDGWNCFDFFVVVVSVASVVLDYANVGNVSFMPVLRVARVGRVVRLIRNATGMQKLLRTLYNSLPALANVGGVMLLFFFIFAVVGVNLFAGIKEGDNLSRHANFDNFPNAMLLLFRMITGEGWNGIMLDCMVTHDCVLVLYDINVTSPTTPFSPSLPASSSPPLSPAPSSSPFFPPSFPPSSPALDSSSLVTLIGGTYLDPSDPLLSSLPPNATDNQCPLSPIAAVVYFPVFVILCTFILLQLVIAVLLENLTEAESDAELPIPRPCVDSFVSAWADVDGAATGFIPASALVQLLCATAPPLGTSGRFNQRVEAQEVVFQTDIPLYPGNRVAFMEVLYALSGSVCGTALPPEVESSLVDQLSRRVPAEEPWPTHTAAHYQAAGSVAAAIRGFLLRHTYRHQLLFQTSNTAAAAAALGSTRPSPKRPPALLTDGLVVNGQLLGDLRRELAAGSASTPPAPRPMRPLLLSKLPSIAPLRSRNRPAAAAPLPAEGGAGDGGGGGGGDGASGADLAWGAYPRTPSARRGRLQPLPPMTPRGAGPSRLGLGAAADGGDGSAVPPPPPDAAAVVQGSAAAASPTPLPPPMPPPLLGGGGAAAAAPPRSPGPLEPSPRRNVVLLPSIAGYGQKREGGEAAGGAGAGGGGANP